MNSKNSTLMDDNAIKGILILSIVIGHSNFLKSTDMGSALIAFLYFWHVQGFFLLISRRDASSQGVRGIDLMVRYFIPYLLVAGGIGLVRAAASGGMGAFQNMLLGLFMGNSSYLDSYSGGVYWFVPTFVFVLISWKFLAGHTDSMVVSAVIVIAGVLSAFLPSEFLKNIPLGLGLVPYMLAMMIIHRFYVRQIENNRVSPLIVLILCSAGAAAVSYLIWAGWTVNVGFFRFGRQPLSMIAGLIFPVLIFEGLVLLTRLWDAPHWLRSVGRSSFGLFLFHQPVLFALTQVGKTLGYETLLGACICIAAIVAAVVVPYLIDQALRRYPLTKRFVFPKDCREFLGTAS